MPDSGEPAAPNAKAPPDRWDISIGSDGSFEEDGMFLGAGQWASRSDEYMRVSAPMNFLVVGGFVAGASFTAAYELGLGTVVEILFAAGAVAAFLWFGHTHWPGSLFGSPGDSTLLWPKEELGPQRASEAVRAAAAKCNLRVADETQFGRTAKWMFDPWMVVTYSQPRRGFDNRIHIVCGLRAHKRDFARFKGAFLEEFPQMADRNNGGPEDD